MTLGQTVREAREVKGLSQKDFAELVGLSGAYVSRLEHDRHEHIGRPSEHRIKAMSDVLGFDFDELCRLAGRIPGDIESYLLDRPKELRRLRRKVRACR